MSQKGNSETLALVFVPETKEPNLHIGGFTIREEVEEAIEKERARIKKENGS